MIHVRVLLLACGVSVGAQIPEPADAPRPLSAEEAVESFRLPSGYRMELVASEPLVREPSGLCWDASGRLYVCELHGYNLEGQYDIDELNRTGQLDREVRRIQANPRAKQAALAGTFGTVKRLEDTDGDGRMDRAVVLADRLPPCYGISPAGDGLIVACAPDIVFLADRDGDGLAEVREKLFSGFPTGALERGINGPERGYDQWLYFGRGHGGGRIIGPKLASAVQLPGTDFRIRPDGSAIEPVMGKTHTFGHAFSEGGDRFVATTSRPGLHVTPLPWGYLARNPHVPAPGSEVSIGDYTRVFPAAPPHPWRVKRAEDPGFFKYYRDRYGASDSEPGGYFTSGCSPFIYQDVALPGESRGAYFLCEPAQNLVHRARLERDGPGWRLRRFPGEVEFLASTDPWFHPIHLAHGPDGAIWIVDMYREIIEDYSAVPRFLQQQYGLTNGMAHGRVWRLTHQDAPVAPSPNISSMTGVELAREVGSPHIWRRRTAARLLVERNAREAVPGLGNLAMDPDQPAGVVLQALYTLFELRALGLEHLRAALAHSDPSVAVHGLRLSDDLAAAAAPEQSAAGTSAHAFIMRALEDPSEAWPTREDPKVLLQLALTLGQIDDIRAVGQLARLAREHGQIRWMTAAIVSSSAARAPELLARLLGDPARLGAAAGLVEPLATTLAGQGNSAAIGALLGRLKESSDASIQRDFLRGVQEAAKGRESLVLPADGQAALLELAGSDDPEVRRLAGVLVESLGSVDPAQARAMVKRAGSAAADLSLPVAARLAAVTRLGLSRDSGATDALLSAWQANTPKVREAIMEAIYARRERLPALVDALESGRVPVAALTAFQRAALLEQEDLRERAARLFSQVPGVSEAVYRRFAAALKEPRDAVHGEKAFREHCATCHQVRGIGFAVGPDLEAEFQRAEEATLRDVLAPNEVITSGFMTYVIESADGRSHSGILADESATSLTLKQAAGIEQIILRKDVARLTALPVSLMPDALFEAITPRELADVIGWLRGDSAGTDRVVLFDDETGFAGQLHEGGGTVRLSVESPFSGSVCLAVTPPQRYNARIDGWSNRIVEDPRAPEEFRYLRLAWRTAGGQGVMLELAAAGRWPGAKEPLRRYYAGTNTTEWEARQVAAQAPEQWRVLTLDLWRDAGPFPLTGIAPTAMGGTAFFDRIELLKRVDQVR